MQEEKPCCDANAARRIRRLTLPNGIQVGIVNLESILKDVTDLKLADDDSIKKELLKRVKAYNYVAPSADSDYSKALFEEYKQRITKSMLD
jgi:hypothetical protein